MFRNHVLAAAVTVILAKLGLISCGGNKDNNAILADVARVTHNFAPFLDTLPGVPKAERFKAVGGSSQSGLVGVKRRGAVQLTQPRNL